MSRNITKDAYLDNDYEYRNYSDQNYVDFYMDDDDEIVSVNYEYDFGDYCENIENFEKEGLEKIK